MRVVEVWIKPNSNLIRNIVNFESGGFQVLLQKEIIMDPLVMLHRPVGSPDLILCLRDHLHIVRVSPILS